MREQFINYEQALKLKELGFDEECFCTYAAHDKSLSRNPSHNMEDLPIEGQPYFWKNSQIHISNTAAPLWQQCWDWFREKHGLHIIIDMWYHEDKSFRGYDFMYYRTWDDKIQHQLNILSEDPDLYDTFEEARLACLNKLIEIVYEKNNLQQ